ncbi:hypothetical protein GZH46_03006, partial [Fragariocoptes setiger]
MATATSLISQRRPRREMQLFRMCFVCFTITCLPSASVLGYQQNPDQTATIIVAQDCSQAHDGNNCATSSSLSGSRHPLATSLNIEQQSWRQQGQQQANEQPLKSILVSAHAMNLNNDNSNNINNNNLVAELAPKALMAIKTFHRTLAAANSLQSHPNSNNNNNKISNNNEHAHVNAIDDNNYYYSLRANRDKSNSNNNNNLIGNDNTGDGDTNNVMAHFPSASKRQQLTPTAALITQPDEERLIATSPSNSMGQAVSEPHALLLTEIEQVLGDLLSNNANDNDMQNNNNNKPDYTTDDNLSYGTSARDQRGNFGRYSREKSQPRGFAFQLPVGLLDTLYGGSDGTQKQENRFMHFG